MEDSPEGSSPRGLSLHLYKTDPEVPPLALGLAVLIPLVVFLLWFATSAGFRQFAMSLNPGILTFVQSWRIVGFTFLVLYTAGLLPGVFDLVTALTLGTTARWLNPNGVATALMTVLPLSLIPTFAVPLLMMLHII